MARRKKFQIDDIKLTRKLAGMNQSDYWSRFGITQSGGSRYEAGRKVPRPALMLIWLRETGRITEEDLAAALKHSGEA